ncbi:MAG: ATP-binding cassette domain-containing protein [Caldisericia bacterium]|nr:ATP-binding cassette domain-containing protein [Caldisericia bacterium]
MTEIETKDYLDVRHEDIEPTFSDDVLVGCHNLHKYFPIHGGLFGAKIADVRAVDGISFEIKKGETHSLVGESGAGKTTAAKTLIRLYDSTGGNIYFRRQKTGLFEDVTKIKGEDLRSLRKEVQIVFQDPSGSLNPRIPVGDIIEEPMIVHGIKSKNERKDRVVEMMKIVGLRPEYLKRYQHEFSGGQRQRIGIARALVLNPELVVCDEAVSALDVSIQSQIINLLQRLQEKFSLTYLFIAHDLAVVRHMSDTIGVMYLGKLVESAPNAVLFNNPAHPYTQALLNAVPVPDPEIEHNKKIIMGDIPSPINPPSGCRFRTRCPKVMDICKVEEPKMKEIEPRHMAACHLL